VKIDVFAIEGVGFLICHTFKMTGMTFAP